MRGGLKEEEEEMDYLMEEDEDITKMSKLDRFLKENGIIWSIPPELDQDDDQQSQTSRLSFEERLNLAV